MLSRYYALLHISIAEQVAFPNSPVNEFLDELTWDRKKRIDTWLIDYLGAEDVAFNRAVSRLVLLAAVRRARKPGSKFDQVLISELVKS